jgi:hypothetical protein
MGQNCVYINNVKLKFEIDTRAAYSIISKSIADTLCAINSIVS